MVARVLSLLSVAGLAVLFASYWAATKVSEDLSPQGCRMSWMSPSYILQSKFDDTWTPLARRYSLWLYREVGWENNNVRAMSIAVSVTMNYCLTDSWQRSCTIYSRKRRLIAPGAIYCILCSTSILRISWAKQRRCDAKRYSPSRRFCWYVFYQNFLVLD
jgi:hypothetical protein